MKQAIVLEANWLTGGAAKSIKTYIECLDRKVDLIVPRILGRETASNHDLRRFYGFNIGEIFELYLPFDQSGTDGWDNYIKNVPVEFIRYSFHKNKKELFEFFLNRDYDNIHLNGIGLWPMIDPRLPMTMHDRQICNNQSWAKKYRDSFSKAKGVVYISNKEYEPIKNCCVNEIVLNNPVDQRNIRTIDAKEVKKKYRIKNEELVFVCGGAISRSKGQDFIIRAFNECGLKEYKLIFAGGAIDRVYLNKCVAEASNNPNIIFTGKWISKDEIDELYAIEDYNIRGDEMTGLGRTTLEALYSGSSVILGDDGSLDERSLNEFPGKVFLYGSRNLDSLVNLLNGLIKPQKGEAGSNADEYASKLDEFILKSLQ